MVIFKKTADLQQYITSERIAGRNIGFIPTMGALHAGHISLINTALNNKDLVVCSIFVNPTQFNDKKDYEKYPVTVNEDIGMLVEAGCDVLFLPGIEEIYPEGTDKSPVFDFGYLDTILEGAQRPGHFKGVGQVVSLLFDAVHPQNVYMGQKDYQQCMVIKKLLAITGLQDKIRLHICPTVREADGLAMSSRNRRLTEPQRMLAGCIYQCLVSIESKADTATFEVVKKECTDLLAAKGFIPEYIALANADDLTLLNNYTPAPPMVALIAVRLGEVRLIDNLVLNNTSTQA
ncbi:MAG: pantoate--beta-alanine ligase [Flavipsychrobacter sp.]|nr:pantoate--beta-alanine ligase [Flavipsychrobacter sp.]